MYNNIIKNENVLISKNHLLNTLVELYHRVNSVSSTPSIFNCHVIEGSEGAEASA